MNLEDCLPDPLRLHSPQITRVSAGLSGAGVYRVDTTQGSAILKVTGTDVPVDTWRRRVEVQHAAVAAGVAPPILHVDEVHRAVVSSFIVDRSFPAFYGNPATRDAAIALLGRTLRRVHSIEIPRDLDVAEPRVFLLRLRGAFSESGTVPKFVARAIEEVLAESAASDSVPHVLSHNDVNPSNLIFDGDNLLLLDWETVAPNDPYYDLASISLFSRMDAGACLQLLTAYGEHGHATVPARFNQQRRLVAALAGTLFLGLSRKGGYKAGDDFDSFASATSLAECYQRMRNEEFSVASPEGQWMFGMALMREGFSDME